MQRRKIFRQFLSVMLICSICLGMVFFVFPQTASATAPEVELYYAKTQYYTAYEGGYYKQYFYIDGYVAVQSGGSNRSVTLHYSQANGTWQDASATYVRTDPAGYEVWHFQSTPTVGRVNGSPSSYSTWWDFAIKYETNGNTYWDNNGGNDYYLNYSDNPTPFVLQKSVVTLDSASKGDTTFSGNIVLKNLAYNKTVGVRYTTDNWTTYTDVNASYSYGLNGNLENWSFSTTIPAGSTIKFAIYYTVNNTTYWDNSFGADYSL